MYVYKPEVGGVIIVKIRVNRFYRAELLIVRLNDDPPVLRDTGGIC